MKIQPGSFLTLISLKNIQNYLVRFKLFKFGLNQFNFFFLIEDENTGKKKKRAPKDILIKKINFDGNKIYKLQKIPHKVN